MKDEGREHLLEDIDRMAAFVDATKGQRFLNSVIDSICIYLLMILLGALIGLFLGFSHMMNVEHFQMVIFVVFTISPFLYYTIFEWKWGRTPGKMFTKTTVVKDDDGRITLKDALLRTLSRVVPFEFISILFGEPWHDQWTKTRVVRK